LPIPEAVAPVIPVADCDVQVYVVPDTFEVKGTTALLAPEQIFCNRGLLITEETGKTVVT
jgi:hypothetical protein